MDWQEAARIVLEGQDCHIGYGLQVGFHTDELGVAHTALVVLDSRIAAAEVDHIDFGPEEDTADVAVARNRHTLIAREMLASTVFKHQCP